MIPKVSKKTIETVQALSHRDNIDYALTLVEKFEVDQPHLIDIVREAAEVMIQELDIHGEMATDVQVNVVCVVCYILNCLYAQEEINGLNDEITCDFDPLRHNVDDFGNIIDENGEVLAG